MRKLVAVMALVLTLASTPFFAWAQLTPDGSGLTKTGGAAYNISADGQALELSSFIGLYIIKPVLGLTGIMFLILTVYAGVMWMTSGGEAKRIEKAKGILVAAVTGTVIVVSAYVITNTVLEALQPIAT